MGFNVGVHEKGTFNLQNALDNIKKDPEYPKVGAITFFVGVVRGVTLESTRVQKLTIESYEEKANQTLTKIANELTLKRGIINIQIHHLLGDFNVGDDLVYVAAAGSHRTQVFSVLQEAVERYKHEVPVFKKEYTIDEKGVSSGVWVSEQGHKH